MGTVIAVLGTTERFVEGSSLSEIRLEYRITDMRDVGKSDRRDISN